MGKNLKRYFGKENILKSLWPNLFQFYAREMF
jgi:hypothetical protein